MAQSAQEFFNSNPDLQVLASRMNAGNGVHGLAKVRELAKKKANMDPDVVVWEVGDKFVIPAAEVLDHCSFTQPIGGNNALGFHIKLVDGRCKNLYLSALNRVLVPYSYDEDTEEYSRNGDIVSSETNFGKKCRSVGTMDDIIQLLLDHPGATVEVTAVSEPITIASRTYDEDLKRNVITGLTTQKVISFEWDVQE